MLLIGGWRAVRNGDEQLRDVLPGRALQAFWPKRGTFLLLFWSPHTHTHTHIDRHTHRGKQRLLGGGLGAGNSGGKNKKEGRRKTDRKREREKGEVERRDPEESTRSAAANGWRQGDASALSVSSLFFFSIRDGVVYTIYIYIFFFFFFLIIITPLSLPFSFFSSSFPFYPVEFILPLFCFFRVSKWTDASNVSRCENENKKCIPKNLSDAICQTTTRIRKNPQPKIEYIYINK